MSLPSKPICCDVESAGFALETLGDEDPHASRTQCGAFVLSPHERLPGTESGIRPGGNKTKTLCAAKKAFCRICWEGPSTKNSDLLVSPCLCSGTQRFVHVSCLKAWQRTVLQNAATFGDERAYRCGVCKALYSISPEPQQTRYQHLCLRVFRLTLVLACLFSIYCGIENVYLWPILGFLGLLVPTLTGLGNEAGAKAYQILLCLTVLLVIVVLRFFVSYSDMKLMLEMMTEGMDETEVGGLSHHRTSIYAMDVRPGALLMSNHDVVGHSSTFSNSVVLLFGHSPTNGSQGVILNQRILSRAESLESGCFSSSSDMLSECVRVNRELNQPHDEEVGEPAHYFGGPMFALERLVVLHRFGNIPGARGIAMGGREGKDPEMIYVGGLMSDVLAEQHKQPSSQRDPIWVFHGISAWSSGQLLEEIDAGAWTVKPGSLDDLVFLGLFDN